MKLQHNKTDATEASDTDQGAPPSGASGAPEARYGERDSGVSRLARHSFCHGSGKWAGRGRATLTERPDLRPMIGPLLANAEALKIQIKRLNEDVRPEAKPRGQPVIDDRAGRWAGQGAGLCGDH